MAWQPTGQQAKQIAIWREQGWTQIKIAQKCGVSRGTYLKWLRTINQKIEEVEVPEQVLRPEVSSRLEAQGEVDANDLLRMSVGEGLPILLRGIHVEEITTNEKAVFVKKRVKGETLKVPKLDHNGEQVFEAVSRQRKQRFIPPNAQTLQMVLFNFKPDEFQPNNAKRDTDTDEFPEGIETELVDE